MSPIRAAGRPPISTVIDPGGTIGATPCGPAGGGIVQSVGLPTTAAGMPPISTVGTPGGRTEPGWRVGWPTRAAGGTVTPQLFLTRPAWMLHVAPPSISAEVLPFTPTVAPSTFVEPLDFTSTVESPETDTFCP